MEPIAVVGRGCVLPGACDPDEFWDVVANGRTVLRPVPEGRWRVPADSLVGEGSERARSAMGGYVTGFESVFVPARYQLPSDLVTELDPVFQWVLHGAGAALREADGDALAARAGLVLGNLSYPSSGLSAYAESVWCQEKRPHPYNRFCSGLPARLAATGLGLGGYAIDAACASSLYAIALACQRLQSGQADLMLAGGVNAADDLFLHVSFSSLGALSPTGRSRPFHASADGLVPAEGAAFVALMRLDDAIAAGRRIHGVIRGIGLSNDGADGGLLTPSEAGQRRAMLAAYRAAGLDPADVGLLECHATGTPVGDAVEVRSSAQVFAGSSDLPVGSAKSNIGHAITAAGGAAMLKVLGALSHGVLPPTPGVDEPIQELAGTPLRVLREAEDWTGPRLAAISAFGFGGCNAHLVIESGPDHNLRSTPEPLVRQSGPPIAVVAVGAQVGVGSGAGDLRRDLLRGSSDAKRRETMEVEADGLRFPPADLQRALAQQLMTLEVAREAAAATTLPAERTMVLAGMGCDPETARYPARWRMAALAEICPPQTSAAVIGAMPNVVANRINAQLDLTGPGFTVSAEEASGLVALDIGTAALRRGDADAVLITAADLSCEPVHEAATSALGIHTPAGDAAVAIVLKRLADAKSAGDTVIAVLNDEPAEAKTPADLHIGDSEVFADTGHFDPAELFGRAHAASGLLSVVVGALALHHRMRPRTGAGAVPALGCTTVDCGSRPLAGPDTVVRLTAGDVAPIVEHVPRGLRVYSGNGKAEVLAALAGGRESDEGPSRLVLVDEGPDRLPVLITRADRWLRAKGVRPAGAAYAEQPIDGEIGFVYPGGSMAYHGMGRDLALAFPEVLDAVETRCGPLPGIVGWAFDEDPEGPRHPLDQIGGTSVVCQVQTAITRNLLGVHPDAAIGYSSGESNALASLHVWPDVSSLLTGARGTDLFTGQVVAKMDVVRRAWRRKGVSGTEWASWLVSASAERVHLAVKDEPVVHLMVVNSPESCVFGGEAQACERVLARLDGAAALRISYDIAAHVPEVREVRERWRELHRLPAKPVTDVRFYTCSTGTSYVPDSDSAADAITAQGLGFIDFAATVRRAWDDGVRIFLEHGPGRQCTEWIRQTLGQREHLAVAFDAGDGAQVDRLFRAAAELKAVGVPVRADELTTRLSFAVPERRRVDRPLAVAAHPPRVQLPEPVAPTVQMMAPAPTTLPAVSLEMTSPTTNGRTTLPEVIARQATLMSSAHRDYLGAQFKAYEEFLAATTRTAGLLRQDRGGRREPVGPAFDREQLQHLATGRVSDLFGPRFAALDGLRRQTRMPAPPLLLADRVLGIDAEPASMGSGTIWTETEVRLDSWYLDSCGRMPPGLQVEAGQADLLLISWLGVDLVVLGERVYRLLGCELTFHGAPAKPGETLRYRIQIDGHEEHGGIRLFSFHYDAYVGDELRLTMRAGQAGFFTDEELVSTGGVTWNPAQAPVPDADRPIDPPAAGGTVRGFTEEEVRAFTEGSPAECFGEAWKLTRTHIRTPRTGAGRLRLLRDVPEYDPSGGPWQRGYLRARLPIDAADWFFEGHFTNDPCMPGNLMLEGCFQALAFYLAAGGHTISRDGWRFEPVTGAPYETICRGQVTPGNTSLTYEVFVSGLSAEPCPEVTADVLCTVDGLPAFHVKDLRIRLVPDWPLDHWRHRELAEASEDVPVAQVGDFRYDYAAMLACAWGKPTDAFGPAYKPFDSHRRLARLPGPPFHFMSRVVRVEGPPWVMQAGSAVEVEYDVPPDAWYFEQNDHADVMPFAVLLEVVLQASGWLASYVGSALTSGEDLLFRNLDGHGTVHREVTPNIGTLRTRTRLREVSESGRMIIQKFEVECTAQGTPIFDLTTVFGFFPPDAFEDQVGIPAADEEFAPSNFVVDLRARPEREDPEPLRLPGPMLLMLDRVTGYWPMAGGPGLGRLRGEKKVDPDEWFFKAHFFQDPVQPGSLGVQAVIQLLQFYVIERGLGNQATHRFSPVLLGEPVQWKYRGQITPDNDLVVVEAEILSVDHADGEIRVAAEGWVWVDGIRIYHVQRLGLSVVPIAR
ncbi:beta-ketoacyl synthase N-terminal-like domain-containing protein [Amycolatopsis japonica]